MTEKTRKKIVYVALAGAVVYGAANLIPSDTKPNQPAPAQEYLDPSAQVTGLREDARLTVDRDSIEALPWGDDPFRLGEVEQVQAPTESIAFELSGIVYNPDAPMAIVNSRPVKTGDIISQARVVAIGRTSVTLEYRGKEMKLTVSEG